MKQRERRFRLVAFDLDGTLVESESSWGTVNRFFGNENRDTMQLYRRGAIDYPEFMRRDIARWPKPLHVSRVRDILSGWVLRRGATELVEGLRERGLELAILSGGIGVLAVQVATRLGIRRTLANELLTDARGFLTGEARMHVDPLRKERALVRLCRAAGIAASECVAVADAEMDRSFLHAAGLGVFVGDAETAAALGVPSVPGLLELLALIDRGP